MAIQTFWHPHMRKQQTLVRFKAKRMTPVIAQTAYISEVEGKAQKIGF